MHQKIVITDYLTNSDVDALRDRPRQGIASRAGVRSAQVGQRGIAVGQDVARDSNASVQERRRHWNFLVTKAIAQWLRVACMI